MSTEMYRQFRAYHPANEDTVEDTLMLPLLEILNDFSVIATLECCQGHQGFPVFIRGLAPLWQVDELVIASVTEPNTKILCWPLDPEDDGWPEYMCVEAWGYIPDDTAQFAIEPRIETYSIQDFFDVWDFVMSLPKHNRKYPR